jgi:general L-amino acid transport system substrate-binding protein
VNIGTTTELNMADFFRANGMEYSPVVFEKADEVVAAYDAGRCDVYTTDQSGLAAQRLKMADPDAHTVLPEVISKEPLGPVVRHGDDHWLDIVKWSLYVMLEAEEYGVNSGNVEEMKGSANPVVKRLLGVEGDMGGNLGLDNDWAARIIAQVGNYGESFDRHVGPDTPVGLPRGVNALWNQGGLMYPMPVR